MEDNINHNAAIFFVDRLVDEGHAEKVAFREADQHKRQLTYGELADQTAKFAGALQAHGVRREERVAMIVQDEIEFPIIFWGSIKAGSIPVPMNTLLSPDIYKVMLEDSRATVVFVSGGLYERVAEAFKDSPCLRKIVVLGDARDGAETYSDFMKDAKALASPVSVCEDEIALWLYSSGSTGAPKGVRHVHSSLKATYDTFGKQVLGIREDDVVYSVAKLFFAYGLGNGITFPMGAGATAILFAGRPTPEAVFEILKNEKPTIFCGVPTLYAAMVNAQQKLGTAPEHSLRICTSAGEALPKEIGDSWDRIWKASIIDGVGSTEMLHIFLSNRPGDIVYGTSGLPVPGYEVRLVDEAGKEVGPDDVGELLVRGQSMADGYWNRREKSQSTFRGPWMHTGDKYERTPDGRFVYCGRSDDMFKSSGIWVSPFEVEQALIEHPLVLEAAVVARKNEEGLEKPAAYIVLKDKNANVPADELKEFVKAKIGMWKYPRWIEIVDELPKTATGKIQRFKLRQGEPERVA